MTLSTQLMVLLHLWLPCSAKGQQQIGKNDMDFGLNVDCRVVLYKDKILAVVIKD